MHDQEGTPLGMVTNGNAWAFVTDNVGSVTALVNTSGSTGASYAYDPYGNLTSHSGGEADNNLIRYTGALIDFSYPNIAGIPGTEYIHLGQRWQSPAAGRFTTQDAASVLADPQNGNRYAYAADNPANYTDPTGQFPWLATTGGFVFGTLVTVTCPAFVVGFTGGLGVGAAYGCGVAGFVAGTWFANADSEGIS